MIKPTYFGKIARRCRYGLFREGHIRKPLLIAAIVLIVLAFGIDLGKAIIPGGATATARDVIDRMTANGSKLTDAQKTAITNTFSAATPPKPPGLGIPYLALLDVLLLYLAFLLSQSFFVREDIQGKMGGIVTFVVTLLVILASIVAAIAALVKLFLMIGLFLSPPFGTIAYMILFGFFDTGTAAAILGLSLFVKLAALVCLVAGNLENLKHKNMMLLFGTSIVANLLLSLLHGLVPSILVSITDDVGAIVVAILALLWALWFLIWSIVSIVDAIPT